MKMSNFQIIFTGVFVIFIVVGVITFSLYTAKQNTVGPVVIWGTADRASMENLLQGLGSQDHSFQTVTYVQKPASSYTADVINGMASGAGPDIILLSQDQLHAFNDKIDSINYGVISRSSFETSYIDEGQIFLTPQGISALPFLVDPLVLYWNRDLFQSAGIAQPPQNWNDLLAESQKLTTLSPTKDIKTSAIALGEWANVLYAKDILATLFMQAGDGIVQTDSTGVPRVLFSQTPQGAPENPAISALQFYTEFADPNKVSYSWNKSLPSSQDDFVGGNLALYVGYASDYPTIKERNPNLRFSVAVMPQIQGNTTHLTFGRLVGLAIPRTASNPTGALSIAEKITSQTGITAAEQAFNLPPVRLDVPQDTSNNAVNAVFNQSALIARGWLDPNPAQTDAIFKTMIEDVISNKSLPSEAVQEAAQSFGALLPQTTQ